MKSFVVLMLLLIGAFAFSSCKKEIEETEETETKPAYTVYKATGNIAATLTEFKNRLGTLNTAPGAAAGRREITWDGIADSLLDKPLPDDFFNQTSQNAAASQQRGLVYTDGNFEASATSFAKVNSEAAGEFQPFSGTKVFANVSKAEWPVGFEAAGQKTPASVKAFGAVFSDVDGANTTSLEFFDGETSLGKFLVPPHDAASSFSFLGVYFEDRTVTKVMVRHEGRLADGDKDVSQGGPKDLVVLDDLVYSEPRRQ